MSKLLPLNAGRVSARELRRRLNDETEQKDKVIAPAIRQLLHNEQIAQEKIAALERFRAMTFWQRVLWLLRGERNG